MRPDGAMGGAKNGRPEETQKDRQLKDKNRKIVPSTPTRSDTNRHGTSLIQIKTRKLGFAVLEGCRQTFPGLGAAAPQGANAGATV